MKKYIRVFGVLVLGIAVISLSSCSTCGTSYRRTLTENPDLEEANESYEKCIKFLDKAECSMSPAVAKGHYVTAQSYLSDAIYKLKQTGHDKEIDVSEDIYYCQKVKRETDVDIGKAGRSMQR